MEMESLCFAAMCTQANIRGAVVCVTLLDRLKEDQLNISREILKMWEERPAVVVARFIRSRLQLDVAK
jgi:uridine phosphorylase